MYIERFFLLAASYLEKLWTDIGVLYLIRSKITSSFQRGIARPYPIFGSLVIIRQRQGNLDITSECSSLFNRHISWSNGPILDCHTFLESPWCLLHNRVRKYQQKKNKKKVKCYVPICIKLAIWYIIYQYVIV